LSISAITYPKAIKIAPAAGKNSFQGQQTMYKDPMGQVTNKDMAFSNYESRINGQNKKIIAHEQAHKAAAGPQAIGSPQYQVMMDPEGRKIITGGYQVIAIPAMVDKNTTLAEIRKAEKAAEYTIAGAEAPTDELSAADKSIATKGRAILASARTAENQREEMEKRLAKPNDGTNPKQAGGKPKKPAVVGARLNFFG